MLVMDTTHIEEEAVQPQGAKEKNHNGYDYIE